MIIDIRSLPQQTTIDTDVCIVGAGVAGITLAREFIREEFRVSLLESGGLSPDRATQSLYWGENTGHPYYPLDTARIGGFGGSSNRWGVPIGDHHLGVRLRPLDGIDFEEREWIPYSGWPFNKAHLDPFYERAQAICKVGPYTYNVKDWEKPGETTRLPLADDRVKTAIFQFGSRDTFTREYRDEITRADNITTFIYANVVEAETDSTAQTVTRLRIASMEGKENWITAKLFILATGAIEIPRLLLLSNKRQKTGLGNQNGLVGRFFMEHPHLWSGLYKPSQPGIINSTALYRVHQVNEVPVMGKLTIAEEVLRREKLLNYCVSIHPEIMPKRPNITPSFKVISWPLLSSNSTTGCRGRDKGAAAPRHSAGAAVSEAGLAVYRKARRMSGRVLNAVRKKKPSVIFQLNHMTEQMPNPDSRVTLGEEVDPLGRRRVRLDWQLSPLDIRSIIRAQEIIDGELRRAGLGMLQIELRDETPPSSLEGGWHHMGTTRMHRDARKGVVDENCRVHGLANLFIAGPSVFPTGGYANPVLTIVALSARLADHVKKVMC
ncbi:MAG: GMC family oxidoreductase [Nitrospirota bacterium]|nr:GMC family oxidoreductase [Nitrospirota bacterium]